MNRRWIIPILIVLVFAGVYVTFNDVVKVTIDGASIDDRRVTFETSEEMDTSINTSIEIGLHRRFFGSVESQIYIDVDALRIGIMDKDQFKILDTQTSADILSLQVFDRYFENRVLPILQINVNGDNRIVVPSETIWESILPEGSKRSIIEDNDTDESWVIPEGVAVEWVFTNTPESVVIENDEGDVLDFNSVDFKFPQYEESTHYVMICNWEDDTTTGQIIYDLNVSIDKPIEAMIHESVTIPGGWYILDIINVDADEEISIEQPFVNHVDIFENNGIFQVMIPVDYWESTGVYEIEVVSNQMDASIKIPVQVKDRAFDVQYLYIDETIESSTRSDEAYEEYAEFMNPARSLTSSESLYEGDFIQPVEGRISTEFGMYRYVNDSLTSYRHSGIDIATEKGTPIVATNSGKVNLARELILTGNTVVIDHGTGIFSVYFHMDTLTIEQGKMVSKGQQIGTVGTTGFSTGPHLHWTMSYYKTNLDPFIFIEEGID
jgi:hypothetical protein